MKTHYYITLTLSPNRWSFEAKECLDISELEKTDEVEIEYLLTTGTEAFWSSFSSEEEDEDEVGDFHGSNPLTSQFHLFFCSAIDFGQIPWFLKWVLGKVWNFEREKGLNLKWMNEWMNSNEEEGKESEKERGLFCFCHYCYHLFSPLVCPSFLHLFPP